MKNGIFFLYKERKKIPIGITEMETENGLY